MATWNSPLKTRFSALIIAFLLTLGGCGGGASDGNSSVIPPPAGTTPPPSGGTPPPSGDTTVENHVTGSVGDGPIVGARLRVFASNGALLTEATSGDSADYDLVIKTQGRNYALTLQADRGIDLVTGGTPDFRLVSAISRPSTRTVSNLNPFTTLIFETARRNGGISDSSVSAAKFAVANRYGFGLDTTLLADPVTTSITGDNVAMVVKTSETLGEMIRRTRDAMNATGQNINGDAVVAALSADLVDGWIDGLGAYESNSRLAAVANVASAAVLVEAMSNELQVYDNNATDAMDLAIRQVRPDAPQTASTRNVTIPANTFQQAARVLRAAQLVDPDPVIAATLEVIETAEPDLAPAILAARLPAGSRGALRRATTSTAYASDDVINAVNARARNTGSTTPPGPDPDPDPTPPPPDPDPEPDPDPTPPPDPEPDPEPPPPPANNPPVISGSPETELLVDAAWSFTPSASDADGDALTFSISGRPSWASFSSSTGRLAGTPRSWHIGTYSNIRISVSDGTDTAQLPAFTLTVSAPPPPPNNPPTISGSPTTALQVGAAWSFTPNASDPDGDTLIFTVSGAPAWLSFSSSTGQLSGTPTSSHVGTYNNIVITVSDGQATASLPAFSLTVSAAPPPPPPPNGSPVISGSPDTTLVVGNPWSFTPTASDPDGDNLTFSITGRPSWMSFNSATGRLSGTPSSSHVGVYQNIVISVTDGQATVSLPAFSLTVTEPQPSTGAATVSWTPPTERVDGSAIGTISSYKIHYSRNAAQLDQLVNVSSGLTSYHIDNLEQGTWYFAVSTKTSDGLESAKSAVVSKTIP